MASKFHRRRRIYQQGGIIPDLRGAQILGQPQQIEQRVNPVRLDPSGAFQALGVRERSKANAISLGSLNRSERQDIWRKEIDERDFLDKKLTALQAQAKAGVDQLTSLNMNSPEQFAMAQDMNRQIQELTAQGQAVLTDNTLTPKERAARLRESTSAVQALMSSPEYVKNMQNNQLANKMYAQMQEAVMSGEFMDNEIADANIEWTRKLENGEITQQQWMSRIKNPIVDSEGLENFEDQYDQMLIDMLDPAQAISNFEVYKNDEGFMITNEKWQVMSEDQQADLLFDLMKTNPNYKHWTMKQEKDGTFVDETGAFSEDRFRAYLDNKVKAARKGIEAAGREYIKGLEVDRPKTVPRTHGTGGTPSANERRQAQVIEGLQGAGYEVLDPVGLHPSSIDSDALGTYSPTAIIELLNTPDDEIVPPPVEGEKSFPPTEEQLSRLRLKRTLEKTIRLKTDDGTGTETGGITTPASGGVGQVNPDGSPITTTAFNNPTTPVASAETPEFLATRVEPEEAISANFIESIDTHESQGDYNALYGFQNKDGQTFEGTNVSEMTLGELKDFSDPKGDYGQGVKKDIGRVATPMGRYQITGTTLRALQKKLDLPDDAVFSPEIQDAMAEVLLDDRIKSSKTQQGKRDGLKAEWEGFKNSTDSELDQIIKDRTDVNFAKRDTSAIVASQQAPRDVLPTITLQEPVSRLQQTHQDIQDILKNNEFATPREIEQKTRNLQLQAERQEEEVRGRLTREKVDDGVIGNIVNDVNNLGLGESMTTQLLARGKGKSNIRANVTITRGNTDPNKYQIKSGLSTTEVNGMDAVIDELEKRNPWRGSELYKELTEDVEVTNDEIIDEFDREALAKQIAEAPTPEELKLTSKAEQQSALTARIKANVAKNSN